MRARALEDRRPGLGAAMVDWLRTGKMPRFGLSLFNRLSLVLLSLISNAGSADSLPTWQ